MSLLTERDHRFGLIHEAEVAARLEADRAVRALISESDRRYEQRLAALNDFLLASLMAQKEAVNAALVAADRAVVKAETASEKRFDAVNEFRATLADQAASLMPRSESEARMQALSDKLSATRDEFNSAVAALNRVQNLNAGQSHGLAAGWGYLVGGAGLAIAIALFIRDFAR
jgi:hypothetical protein